MTNCPHCLTRKAAIAHGTWCEPCYKYIEARCRADRPSNINWLSQQAKAARRELPRILADCEHRTDRDRRLAYAELAGCVDALYAAEVTRRQLARRDRGHK
jgi:hypothetical protein